MSKNLELLLEVEKIMILKAPLTEFDAVSNEQIIFSPSFQSRIFDALIDLLLTHTKTVQAILENNEELIAFTESFVHFYREKTLNVISNV